MRVARLHGNLGEKDASHPVLDNSRSSLARQATEGQQHAADAEAAGRDQEHISVAQGRGALERLGVAAAAAADHRAARRIHALGDPVAAAHQRCEPFDVGNARPRCRRGSSMAARQWCVQQERWGKAGRLPAAREDTSAAASCLLYQCVASQPLFTTDSSTSVAYRATDRRCEGLRVLSECGFGRDQ